MIEFSFFSEEHKAALKFSIMDQLNLSDGKDLPQEILEKMKKMPVPDELLNFLGTFEQRKLREISVFTKNGLKGNYIC